VLGSSLHPCQELSWVLTPFVVGACQQRQEWVPHPVCVCKHQIHVSRATALYIMTYLIRLQTSFDTKHDVDASTVEPAARHMVSTWAGSIWQAACPPYSPLGRSPATMGAWTSQ
jgi:hypothetical protein